MRKNPTRQQVAKHDKRNFKRTPLAFDDHNVVEDKPISLLKKLELEGNLRATSEVQMMLARKHYVKENKTPKEIARLVAVHPSVVEKWAVLFEWDEARNRYQFERWSRVAKIAKLRGVQVDERADRLYHSIEHVVETLLHNHHEALRAVQEADEDEDTSFLERQVLRPTDLKALAATIKETRGERKTIRGESANQNEQTRKLEVDVSGNVDIMHRLGQALGDFTGAIPHKVEAQAELRAPELIEDAEFEELEDD